MFLFSLTKPDNENTLGICIINHLSVGVSPLFILLEQARRGERLWLSCRTSAWHTEIPRFSPQHLQFKGWDPTRVYQGPQKDAASLCSQYWLWVGSTDFNGPVVWFHVRQLQESICPRALPNIQVYNHQLPLLNQHSAKLSIPNLPLPFSLFTASSIRCSGRQTTWWHEPGFLSKRRDPPSKGIKVYC